MDHHSQLPLQDLQLLKEETEKFIESNLFKYLLHDLTTTRNQILESAADTIPDSYAAQNEREQMFGEARQLKLLKGWFALLLEELNQQIEQKETE